MIQATITRINRFPFPLDLAPTIGSICWHDDTLVDWALGHRYHLDGRSEQISDFYGHQFNGATTDPTGTYTCIYEKHGTKGLLLRNGVCIREISRSYYHAGVHEFPVALFRLPDSRDVIAHCPDHYGRIEIDDILTGERLTADSGRETNDLFHSRFAVDPGGRRLMSAGWIWHPSETLSIFDIGEGIADPGTLDDYRGMAPPITVELCSAAFFGTASVMLSTTDEVYEWEDRGDPLGPLMLAHYDLEKGSYTSMVSIGEIAGTIIPLTERYVVGLLDHPKVFDMVTGKIIHRIPELPTGKQEGVIFGASTVPPMAFDSEGHRIAVGDATGITVVQYRIG